MQLQWTLPTKKKTGKEKENNNTGDHDFNTFMVICS
jgi:hypothetical protein